MIETLFKTQEKWAVSQDWRPALERTARLAGVSSKDFDDCLANKALEDEIVQSRLTAATQLDVNATPTFLSTARSSRGRRPLRLWTRCCRVWRNPDRAEG